MTHLTPQDSADIAHRRIGLVRDLEERQRVVERGQWISQLVRQSRQKLILVSVRFEQRLLGSLSFEKMFANLVLPLASSQCDADGADQRRHTHRALEQRD